MRCAGSISTCVNIPRNGAEKLLVKCIGSTTTKNMTFKIYGSNSYLPIWTGNPAPTLIEEVTISNTMGEVEVNLPTDHDRIILHGVSGSGTLGTSTDAIYVQVNRYNSSIPSVQNYGDVYYPIFYLKTGTGVSFYNTAANANTGGTMIENHWDKLSIEAFGTSAQDGNGYPTNINTTGKCKIIGFNTIDGAGTVLAEGSEAISIDISAYPYIKIVGYKPSGGTGASLHAINMRLTGQSGEITRRCDAVNGTVIPYLNVNVSGTATQTFTFPTNGKTKLSISNISLNALDSGRVKTVTFYNGEEVIKSYTTSGTNTFTFENIELNITDISEIKMVIQVAQSSAIDWGVQIYNLKIS